jgi:type III secretory pathway component EscV
VPALLVGAIVVSILVLLPGLIGTVFTVLAVVVGVGALVLSVRQREVAGAAGTPQPPAAGPMAADGAVAAPVTVM